MIKIRLKTIILFILFGVLCFGVFKGYEKIKEITTPDVDQGYLVASKITKNEFNAVKPTVVKDSSGNVVAKIGGNNQYTVKNIKSVSNYLKKGYVAVEDKRFYEHHGVDPYGTLRATALNVLHKSVQGGSTITQQLVKNEVLHNQTQSYHRKIQEMVIAQRLEKKLTKSQILLAYMNTNYYGHGAYGINAAAHYYFGKSQKDLLPQEAAILLSLSNNPTLYDPVNVAKNSSQEKVILDKRNTLLYVFYKNGVITKKQYEKAKKSAITLHITQLSSKSFGLDRADVNYALSQAAEDLMTVHGFQFKYWFTSDAERKAYLTKYNQQWELYYDQIAAGGYTIQTSINTKLQTAVTNAANSVMKGQTPQAAFTVIDNNTRRVVAVYGGTNYKAGSFNRATSSYRQPGSSIKPILDYAPAVEHGLLPQTLLANTKLSNLPSVSNDDGYITGELSAREALRDSYNLTAIRAMEMAGFQNAKNKLVEMEFGDLAPEDNNEIIGIGGFTYGVSTVEMAAAYSTLANEGSFVAPTNVTAIVDGTGSTVYTVKDEAKQVYKPSAAYITLDMMKSVTGGPTEPVKAWASDYPEDLQSTKPGQTDNNKDSYFVETNKYYSSAVWVGYDSDKNLSTSQIYLPMLINHAVQNILLKGKKSSDFTRPSNVSGTSLHNLYINGAEPVISSSDGGSTWQTELQREKTVASNNQSRLNSMDYRIIYGLSKSQEQNRELATSEAIDQISTAVNSDNDFSKSMLAISKAKKKNNLVMHQATKNSNYKKINELLAQVTNAYSTYLTNKQVAKDQKLQTSIANAKQQVSAENQSKINTLKKQLPSLITQLASAYASDSSDKSSLKQKLVSDINEIRSLGGTYNDVSITVTNNGTIVGG